MLGRGAAAAFAQVQLLSDCHPDIMVTFIEQDVANLEQYNSGYAVEASLLIADTLKNTQMADGIQAYLQSLVTGDWTRDTEH